MAKNFEIIFPVDETITDRKGNQVLFTLDKIKGVVESHNCKYLIAKHPIDKHSTKIHYHCGIHTESDNTYDTIAKWFDLPENSVQKINKRFDTTYALYLAHYNQGEKTPVDPNTILRNFDLDYGKLIANIENKIKDDEVLNKIANGDITEFELYNTMPAEWLRKHKRDIDISLQVRSKIFMVGQKERDMQVVYITGQARCGKSYFAKKLASQNNYSYYVSSNGEHPFDDYMGQDAVILDDLRPSDFKFSELLKVLDNHMSSKVSARYHNIDLNCKVIYITTILPIGEFYKNLQESNDEAVEQLKGRINTLFDVSKEHVSMYILEQDNKSYKLMGSIPNPILTDEQIELMTEEDRYNLALKMLGGLGDMFTNVADTLKNVPQGFEPFEDGDQIKF